VQKLAVQAAITIDPESATRRREDAEQNKSRVSMFREESGAAALSGRDMPTDQTLAAHASVCARAEQYKESGAFGDVRMDQYRVAAYLDLLNGISAAARIASGQIITVTPTSAAPEDDGADPGDDTGNDDPNGDDPDGDDTGNDDPGSDDPDGDDDGGPDGDGPRGGSPASPGGCARPDGADRSDRSDRSDQAGPGAGGSQPDDSRPRTPPAPPPAPQPAASPQSPPRLADLILPLATLLGLAERPGEGHGLGPLDPDLCRALAASAIGSRYSRLCVTVTDSGGIAIGHGCARLARRASPRDRPGSTPGQDGQGPPGGSTALALPARANLTITATRLTELAASAGPPGRAPWSFTRDDPGPDNPGPPGAYGTWTLTLPDGRNLIVALEQVPTFDCDHKHESHAYQPNDTLRHLVQIRDGECTFPPCSRHARESDFEHAVPYDKGGKTCACNAGARSRQCHQVKQSPGWNVSQPKPAWHQWETPSGRVYTQGPKRYPAD
jgi:hypothetical protein